MADFFSAAFAAIPSAATNKFALIAYALAIGAYVATVWRVLRNKNLLKHLESLPPEDRIGALEIEMGGVRLAEGISPEQWLRSRTQRFYFVAFVVTCLLVLLIFTLAIVTTKGTADISVDLYQRSSEPRFSGVLSSFTAPAAYAAQSEFVDPNTATQREPAAPDYLTHFRDDTLVTYSYQKVDRKVKILPHLGYADAQREGKPVEGLYWWSQPFKWNFPLLAVKVVNNTTRDLLLTEVVLDVRASKVDRRPIIVVRLSSYRGAVELYNDGWGSVLSPNVRFSVKDPRECDGKFALDNPRSQELPSFDDDTTFSIRPYVSQYLINRIRKCVTKISWICAGEMCSSPGGSELDGIECLDQEPNERCSKVSKQAPKQYIAKIIRDAIDRSPSKYPELYYKRNCSEAPVCVDGELTFRDEDQNSGSVKFVTVVYLEEPSGGGAPRPPSYTYDVFLEAGKQGYVFRKSISQEIKAGEADQFLIRVASDKSVSFDLNMQLLSAGDKVAWSGDIGMDLLVPRSGAALAFSHSQY